MSGSRRQVYSKEYVIVKRILSKLSEEDSNELRHIYFHRYYRNLQDFGYLISDIIEVIRFEKRYAREIKEAVIRQIKEDKPSLGQLIKSFKSVYIPRDVRETVRHLLDEIKIGLTTDRKLVLRE